MQRFTWSPHTLGGNLGDRHSQCSWKDLVPLLWPCSVGLGNGTACSLLGALLGLLCQAALKVPGVSNIPWR